MRVLVLVDGEHYPPVTRWGIEVARERRFEPVLALLLGGTEKVGAGEVPELGIPVLRVDGLKQKCLVAHRSSIKHVVVPKQNQPELEEVPEAIREELELHTISRIEEVLPLVFSDRKAFNHVTAAAPSK